jgi:hypothetical protein
MQGLDAWLEAPYVDAARQQDEFERWCDAEDVDPDAPDAWDRFEADCEDRAEAADEARAEARMDRDR